MLWRLPVRAAFQAWEPSAAAARLADHPGALRHESITSKKYSAKGLEACTELLVGPETTWVVLARSLALGVPDAV